MKILKYKLFESEEMDWKTTDDEIREYFYDLEDLGCDIIIQKIWITDDLKKTEMRKLPGYYPGFSIKINPRLIKGIDFAKHIEYLKLISESNGRLSSNFKAKVVQELQDRDTPFSYVFYILDGSWGKFKWSDDDILKYRFVSEMPRFNLRYGQVRKIEKTENQIKIIFTQGVSRPKSIANVQHIRQMINDRLSPKIKYDITEETMVNRAGNSLVTAIIITFLGKKDEDNEDKEI